LIDCAISSTLEKAAPIDRRPSLDRLIEGRLEHAALDCCSVARSLISHLIYT
jgi:hypothetical protein